MQSKKTPFFFNTSEKEITLNPRASNDYLKKIIDSIDDDVPETVTKEKKELLEDTISNINDVFRQVKERPGFFDINTLTGEMLKLVGITKSPDVAEHIISNMDDDFLSQLNINNQVKSAFTRELKTVGLSEKASRHLFDKEVITIRDLLSEHSKETVELEILDIIRGAINAGHEGAAVFWHEMLVSNDPKNQKLYNVELLSNYLFCERDEPLERVEQILNEGIHLDEWGINEKSYLLELMSEEKSALKEKSLHINRNALKIINEKNIPLVGDIFYIKNNVLTDPRTALTNAFNLSFSLSVATGSLQDFKDVLDASVYDQQMLKEKPNAYLNLLNKEHRSHKTIVTPFSVKQRKSKQIASFDALVYEKVNYLIESNLINVQDVDLLQFVDTSEVKKDDQPSINWFKEVGGVPKNNYYHTKDALEFFLHPSMTSQISNVNKYINELTANDLFELSSDTLAVFLENTFMPKSIKTKIKKVSHILLNEETSVGTLPWWHARSPLDYVFFLDEKNPSAKNLVDLAKETKKGKDVLLHAVDKIVEGQLEEYSFHLRSVINSAFFVGQENFKGMYENGNNVMHILFKSLLQKNQSDPLLAKFRQEQLVEQVLNGNGMFDVIISYASKKYKSMNFMYEKNAEGESPWSLMKEDGDKQMFKIMMLKIAVNVMSSNDVNKKNDEGVLRIHEVDSWMNDVSKYISSSKNANIAYQGRPKDLSLKWFNFHEKANEKLQPIKEYQNLQELMNSTDKKPSHHKPRVNKI